MKILLQLKIIDCKDYMLFILFKFVFQKADLSSQIWVKGINMYAINIAVIIRHCQISST